MNVGVGNTPRLIEYSKGHTPEAQNFTFKYTPSLQHTNQAPFGLKGELLRDQQHQRVCGATDF